MAESYNVFDAQAAERKRCISICESWIGAFQDRDIKYTTPREYAINAVEDILDLIRNGHHPGDAAVPGMGGKDNG